MLKQLSTQKKILLTVTAVLLVIASAFVILLVTAESAVAGVWRRQDAFTSNIYGTAYTTYTLFENGTFTKTITDAISGETLTTTYGTWSISGFDVRTADISNSIVHFTYNPFTGILNNGGFWVSGSDIPFIRIG